MTLTLDLTPEQEDLLLRFFAKSQRSGDECARVILLAHARQVEIAEREAEAEAAANAIPPGESLYDALKDHIGTINSPELAALCERPGDAFGDILMEKKRQDRL